MIELPWEVGSPCMKSHNMWDQVLWGWVVDEIVHGVVRDFYSGHRWYKQPQNSTYLLLFLAMKNTPWWSPGSMLHLDDQWTMPPLQHLCIHIRRDKKSVGRTAWLTPLCPLDNHLNSPVNWGYNYGTGDQSFGLALVVETAWKGHLVWGSFSGGIARRARCIHEVKWKIWACYLSKPSG